MYHYFTKSDPYSLASIYDLKNMYLPTIFYYYYKERAIKNLLFNVFKWPKIFKALFLKSTKM